MGNKEIIKKIMDVIFLKPKGLSLKKVKTFNKNDVIKTNYNEICLKNCNCYLINRCIL